MYLSQCEINPSKRSARQVLASTQRIHAMVLSCFPRSAEEENGRVLWRIDRRKHGVYLLIVSKMKPDLTVVQEQVGWPDSKTAKVLSYDRFLENLTEGGYYQFRLVANPVRNVHSGPGTARQKIPHTTVKAQKQWLLDRSEQCGFEIPAVAEMSTDAEESSEAFEIVVRDTLSFSKDRGKRKVSITTATYEGILKVKDASRLRQVLTAGIGRAKAYGCGMLTLIPLEQ